MLFAFYLVEITAYNVFFTYGSTNFLFAISFTAKSKCNKCILTSLMSTKIFKHVILIIRQLSK